MPIKKCMLDIFCHEVVGIRLNCRTNYFPYVIYSSCSVKVTRSVSSYLDNVKSNDI